MGTKTNISMYTIFMQTLRSFLALISILAPLSKNLVNKGVKTLKYKKKSVIANQVYVTY